MLSYLLFAHAIAKCSEVSDKTLLMPIHRSHMKPSSSHHPCALIFSAVKFAELCAKPSFRMHLRTESALVRVLDLLKDAPEVPVGSLNEYTPKNPFFVGRV
jgi:hypothetical protein